MGPRGGRSSSTPPRGANRARMALARSFPLEGSWSSAALKIALASCSIDLPFSAARMRRRRFSPSSKLRTVILSKTVPPSALSFHCNMIALQSFRCSRPGAWERSWASRFDRSALDTTSTPHATLSLRTNEHASHTSQRDSAPPLIMKIRQSSESKFRHPRQCKDAGTTTLSRIMIYHALLRAKNLQSMSQACRRKPKTGQMGQEGQVGAERISPKCPRSQSWTFSRPDLEGQVGQVGQAFRKKVSERSTVFSRAILHRHQRNRTPR